MALEVVIFDLDGTLIDSNWIHAQAFAKSFQEFGYHVGTDRIVQEIGKGGSFIVPYLLGEEAERQHGDAIRTGHDERYMDMVEEGVPLLPGARELVEALNQRGLKTAIATGSKRKSMEHVMRYTEVDLTELVDEVVSDTDVERSKPHPDPVEAAVKKFDVSPAQCMMLGDTPYDAAACWKAGVVLIGVLTGVHPAKRMHEAGTRKTYEHTQDVLEHLDEVLTLASPGDEPLTGERIDTLMQEALREARRGLKEGERPIGSVLARSDGSIIARGHSRSQGQNHPLAHAEMEVLDALRGTTRKAADLVLVSTLEPCVMCLGAAMEAGIDTVVYALDAPSSGGTTRCRPLKSPGAVVPRLVSGIRAEESRDLLSEWLQRHPTDAFAQALVAE